VLTFWVFPALVATLTPFTYRQVMRASKTALITAFATGKVLIVLPMLVEATKELFAESVSGGPERDQADANVDVLYPLVYPFPHAGKLVGLLFIPFAAWFVGRPLALIDYPMFLGAGLLSYFGGPIVATPFLLDLAHLPSDMMHLFLVSGIYCGRLGDLLGTMHLVSFTLITGAAVGGLFRIHIGALVWRAGFTAALVFVCVFGSRAYLERTFVGTYQKTDVLAAINSIVETADFVVLARSEPNPVPLEPGQSRIERLTQRRVLRVGFDPDQFPFAFYNQKGELVGFDIEMAHELGKDTFARIEFVPVPLNEIRQRLEDDHVDIVMSGLFGSLGRAAEMGISEPYLQVHPGFVVLDGDEKTFESLKRIRQEDDLVIAIIDETIAVGVHRFLPDATVKRIEAAQEFFESPEPIADALLVSAEAGSAWTIAYAGYNVVVPRGLRFGVPLVYALPRDDRDFRQFINHWIDSVQREGTVDKLYDHWVLGRQDEDRPPRWSIIRDVLGWVE
jgi:ABC-type amino acid transport substrate-binding protein